MTRRTRRTAKTLLEVSIIVTMTALVMMLASEPDSLAGTSMTPCPTIAPRSAIGVGVLNHPLGGRRFFGRT